MNFKDHESKRYRWAIPSEFLQHIVCDDDMIMEVVNSDIISNSMSDYYTILGWTTTFKLITAIIIVIAGNLAVKYMLSYMLRSIKKKFAFDRYRNIHEIK